MSENLELHLLSPFTLEVNIEDAAGASTLLGFLAKHEDDEYVKIVFPNEATLYVMARELREQIGARATASFDINPVDFFRD